MGSQLLALALGCMASRFLYRCRAERYCHVTALKKQGRLSLQHSKSFCPNEKRYEFFTSALFRWKIPSVLIGLVWLIR